MSGWATVGDVPDSSPIPSAARHASTGSSETVPPDHNVQQQKSSSENMDVPHQEMVAPEGVVCQDGDDDEDEEEEDELIEESDEAFQSRLSLQYQQTLHGHSESRPGSDQWSACKDSYLDILYYSQPTRNPQAKRLLETTDKASNGLTVLHRLRYLCYKQLGSMAYEEGNLDESLAFYADAMEVEDDDVTAWYNMATVAAAQQKLARARYFLERALRISPHHLLCLRRLASLLSPAGIDDTMGYARVKRLLDVAVNRAMSGSTTITASGPTASKNPFFPNSSNALDWGGIVPGRSVPLSRTTPPVNNDTYVSTIPGTVWSNIQPLKQQRRLIFEAPSVVHARVVNYSLTDVTFVGLGNVLIDAVTEEIAAIEKLAPGGGENTVINIRCIGENEDFHSLLSSDPVAVDVSSCGENVASTRVVTVGGDIASVAAPSRDRDTIPQENLRGEVMDVDLAPSELSHQTESKPPGKKRVVSNVEAVPKKNQGRGSAKKPKLSNTSPAKLDRGKAPKDKKGTLDSAAPRASRRLSSRKEEAQEASQHGEEEQVEIHNFLSDVLADRFSVEFSKQNDEVEDQLAGNILKGVADECVASTDNIEYDTSAEKSTDTRVAVIFAANEDSNNDKREASAVVNFVTTMNAMNTTAQCWLQQFVKKTLRMSPMKFTHTPRVNINGALRNDEIKAAEKCFPEVIARAISLLSKQYAPVGTISAKALQASDGGMPEDAKNRSSHSKPVSKKKSISSRRLHAGKSGRPNKLMNIHVSTGLGMHFDALAWLTRAELYLDHANRISQNMLGTGSTSVMNPAFYQKKKHENLKACERCVEMMWRALIKIDSFQPSIGGCLKRLLPDITAAELSAVDEACLKRTQYAEHYLAQIWEGRLRFYWLCACWDKLEERYALSLIMLRICSTVLKEQHAAIEYSASGSKTAGTGMYYINHCVHYNVIDQSSLVGRLNDLASKATIDKAIVYYNLAKKLPVDAPKEERVELYEKAIVELRNRYLPRENSDSGNQEEDAQWTSHYGELFDDFFVHQPNTTHNTNGESRIKRKKRRGAGYDDDNHSRSPVRSDLVKIISQTCLGAGKVLLAARFLAKIMEDTGKEGGMVSSACSSYVRSMRRSSKRVAVTSDSSLVKTNATDNADKAQSRTKRMIERALVFSSHLLKCAFEISTSAPRECRDEAWGEIKTALPPFVRMVTIMQERELFAVIVKSAHAFGDASFALALSWRLASNCNRILQSTSANSSCTTTSGSPSKSKGVPNRWTYTHESDKWLQKNLSVENLDTESDCQVIDLLQTALEVSVDCFAERITRRWRPGDDQVFPAVSPALVFAMLRLSVHVVHLAKRIPALRYCGLNSFFTFICVLVPVDASPAELENSKETLDSSLASRHEYLRTIIATSQCQLREWRLATARKGQLLKSFVAILTTIDEIGAAAKIARASEDDLETHEYLLGQAYYDLYGLLISPEFQTKSPSSNTFLNLANESCEFCADLFEFSFPFLQDASAPAKDRRGLLTLLHKVFDVDVSKSAGETGKKVLAYLHENDGKWEDMLTSLLSMGTGSDGHDESNDFRTEQYLYEMHAELLVVPGAGETEKWAEFYYDRIHILKQDVSFNPTHAQSWYGIGDAAGYLLNYQLDKTSSWLSQPLSSSSATVQTTMGRMGANALSLSSSSSLRQLALRAFTACQQINSKLPERKLAASNVHEQIGIIMYNNARYMKVFGKRPQARIDVVKRAFGEFESANKLSPHWVFKLLMGKLALKIDSYVAPSEDTHLAPAGVIASVDGEGRSAPTVVDEKELQPFPVAVDTPVTLPLLSCLKRAIGYFRQAFDEARALKRFPRDTEYTTYRLYATVVKGVLVSHQNDDSSALALIEEALPGYTKKPKSSPVTRRYDLLVEALAKLKSIIAKSVTTYDHRSRHMVAYALFHGKVIAEAAGVPRDEVKDAWGAMPALEMLRTFFVKQRNGGAYKYHPQLVGLWFEIGNDREKSTFDLLQARPLKYNCLRDKYLRFYIHVVEACRGLNELNCYLHCLERQYGDKQTIPITRMITDAICLVLNAVIRVIQTSTGVIDLKEAEETLKVTYHCYLSSMIFCPSLKEPLTTALVQAFDVYQRCMSGSAAQMIVPEIEVLLQKKFPSVKGRADIFRSKKRLKLRT